MRILYYCQSLVGVGHLACSLRITCSPSRSIWVMASRAVAVEARARRRARSSLDLARSAFFCASCSLCRAGFARLAANFDHW